MRRFRSISRGATALVLTLLVAAPARAGISGSDRCRIAKLDAMAVATRSGLRCWAQAIRQGRAAPAPECVVPPDGKLERAFERAERQGACPPTALDAGLAIFAFVTAQGRSVFPLPSPGATATPTASPTPSSVPSAVPTPPGCGNGMVEPGENCDGGVYCDPACNFAFPSLCCEIASLCVALAGIPDADQCFLAGGTPRIGTACVSMDPSCIPGLPCVGACLPATFPPTEFCCDGGGGCTQRTLSDTESLGSLLLQCGGEGVVEGTCVAGDCIPGG